MKGKVKEGIGRGRKEELVEEGSERTSRRVGRSGRE
jgi:hypothetical protein